MSNLLKLSKINQLVYCPIFQIRYFFELQQTIINNNYFQQINHHIFLFLLFQFLNVRAYNFYLRKSIQTMEQQQKQQLTSSLKASNTQINSPKSRLDKLNEIDALYKTQMNKIYQENKNQAQKDFTIRKQQTLNTKANIISSPILITPNLKNQQHERVSNVVSPEKVSIYNSNSSKSILGIGNSRASIFLKGQSVRTIESLRRENESKQLKIRDLASICQHLIEKLRNTLPPQQVQKQMATLKQFSEQKMARLENLFKIKNQEIFFKIKLQIISLLQEFEVSKEDIAGINQISNESDLFNFLVKKLKAQLKHIKSKQQQSNMQIKKDKIITQQSQERIHFLVETNQLLKLSQSKLKNKNEDLRNQLNQFIDRLKKKDLQLQAKQNQIFRLKKENQQLYSSQQKVSITSRSKSSEFNDQRRIYEAKQKQMKTLLSNYYMEKKQLQAVIEEKQTLIEELLIKQKFLEQENQKLNRQYVRWKERYEWLEKQKENRQRQFEEERIELMKQFELYRSDNNQGLYLRQKAQTQEALRKAEEFQSSYQKLLYEAQQQKGFFLQKQDQFKRILDQTTYDFQQKLKKMQKEKEEIVFQLINEHSQKIRDLKNQYENKQKLLSEEMKGKTQVLIAGLDKENKSILMELENQNQQLKREVEQLNRLLGMKQSLSNAILSNRESKQESRKSSYSGFQGYKQV